MSNDLTNAGRKVRAREIWLRYDSIVIGPGASRISSKWFENFADFANADNLVWFDGSRTKSDGLAYCNVSGDTEDWAQMIYQSGIEFIAPIGAAGFDAVGIENVGIMQNLFVNELPKRMSFRVNVMDTDDIATAPGIYYPPGVGTSGQTGLVSSAISFQAGQTGSPEVRNTWSWPEPIEIPARSKITMEARIDKPIGAFLQQLDLVPGSKTIPVPAGGFTSQGPALKDVPLPNWYVIRCWHRGPRFVQLRGARTAG